MNKQENEYVDFVVTARAYKTLLTTKYKNRKIWQKPNPGDVVSTLPGTIVAVEVAVGDQVAEGQLLLMHQAMKMYNRILSPVTGTVTEVNVSTGDRIAKEHLMIKIEPK